MSDKLPPEVAEAIAALDAMTYAGSRTHAHWSCVKDHLHRLAEGNARLLAKLDALKAWLAAQPAQAAQTMPFTRQQFAKALTESGAIRREAVDDPVGFDSGFTLDNIGSAYTALQMLMQAAQHPGLTHCDNCGLTWLDDGINPIGCPYCKPRAAQPSADAECPKCGAPCHRTVHMRGGDWGWSTTDEQRAEYKFVDATRATEGDGK